MQNKPTNESKPFGGIDPANSRNDIRFGFTPQAEIWNGRFAMIGFIAYLLWDLEGVSVARSILHLTP